MRQTPPFRPSDVKHDLPTADVMALIGWFIASYEWGYRPESWGTIGSPSETEAFYNRMKWLSENTRKD